MAYFVLNTQGLIYASPFWKLFQDGLFSIKDVHRNTVSGLLKKTEQHFISFKESHDLLSYFCHYYLMIL